MKLAFKCLDSFYLFVVEFGDVDNEVGIDVAVLDRMEDLFWSPWLLLVALLVVGFHHSQPGIEAGFGNQRAAAPMIGVAVVYCIGNDDFRAVFANKRDDRLLMRFVVFEKAVGQSHIFPHLYAQNACGIQAFQDAALRCPARTQFTSCQIYNADFLAQRDLREQCTGAAQFDIVGMRCDGKDI
ncbi:hypothetical protein D3C87_1509180 [compost metagenome]